MNDPVAALFRVQLEALDDDEMQRRPVATGQFSVCTFSIVACDADVAVATARRLAADEGKHVRLLSVELVETITALA